MIVYNTATTANGFLADPHDSLDWLFRVPGEAPDMEPFTRDVAVCVMGATTYEWILREERLLEQPHRWAEHFRGWPTYVFTTRELPVPAGADVRFARGPVAAVVPLVKKVAGGGTVWLMGGGDIVGQFLDAHALDRITLTLAPVFLASGKPLLPRTVPPEALTLVSTRQVGQFVEVTYDVAHPDERTAT